MDVASVDGPGTTAALPATETAPANPPLWAPLRSPAFRYLLIGQSTSMLGDQLLIVALPFIVLGSGAGARGLGAVFAAYGAARVVALPVGGLIADKLPRRAVMLASDIARAALVLSLFAVSGGTLSGVGIVAALMGAVGFAEGIFLPSSLAIIPATVDADLLGRANGLSSGAQNLAMLLGPGLGGLLAWSVSPRLCLAIDAATFAVSIAMLLLVRPRTIAAESADGENADALRFFRTSTLLKVAVAITIVSNLAYYGMLEVSLPVFSADVMRTAVYGFGTTLAAFGLGSLLGSLAIPILDRQPRRGVVAIGLGVLQGAAFAAIAAQGLLPLTAALMAIAGFTCGVLNVFYLSRIQEHVPDHLLGRAMSVIWLAVFAIHPLSVWLAGQITAAAGPAIVFLAAGLSIAIASGLGGLTRTYREL